MKSSLQLVTTRYGLSGRERSILYRGFSKPEPSKSRNKKLSLIDLRDREIHIDAMNVVITLNSYFTGEYVFTCLDGFLRDSAEQHGHGTPKFYKRCIDLIIDDLAKDEPGEVFFYLDKKPDPALILLRYLEDKRTLLPAESVIVYSDESDSLLGSVTNGCIATSDSVIIDRATVAVIDLAKRILTRNFNPDFLNLADLVD